MIGRRQPADIVMGGNPTGRSCEEVHVHTRIPKRHAAAEPFQFYPGALGLPLRFTTLNELPVEVPLITMLAVGVSRIPQPVRSARSL